MGGDKASSQSTSAAASLMSDASRDSPRAVIHKRILDRAEANPEASISDIANAISGASPDLVERVLDQYGDPADDQSAQPDTGSNSPTADGEHTAETKPGPDADSDADTPAMDFDDLSEKQQAVLREISHRPDATQAELAEQLDVSRATISNRVNAIEGLEWSDRHDFVSDLDAMSTASDGGQAQTARNLEEELVALQEQLADLERRLEELPSAGESSLQDQELLAKVVRACVADEAITNEEEVQILEELLA